MRASSVREVSPFSLLSGSVVRIYGETIRSPRSLAKLATERTTTPQAYFQSLDDVSLHRSRVSGHAGYGE